jgi:hypothetical protein
MMQLDALHFSVYYCIISCGGGLDNDDGAAKDIVSPIGRSVSKK